MFPTLVLASSSPRRRALLDRAGYRPVIRAPSVDETRQPREEPGAYVARMARTKAETARPQEGGEVVVVAADTVVVAGDEVLGKPADAAAAVDMLRLLSDGWHRVISGFVVGRPEGLPAAQAVETRVRFKALNPAEINWYVATGEWSDKAGGYGIQDHAAFMVTEIEGSYTNVMGLPLAEVVSGLIDLGLEPRGGEAERDPHGR
jgi:septum formation protein